MTERINDNLLPDVLSDEELGLDDKHDGEVKRRPIETVELPADVNEPLPSVAEIMAMGEESLKTYHPSLYAYMEGLKSLPSQTEEDVNIPSNSERTLTLTEVEAVVQQMGLDLDARKFALQVAATMYAQGRTITEVIDAAGQFEAYLTAP